MLERISRFKPNSKKLSGRVTALQAAYPQTQFEVWAFSRQKIGLAYQPIARKVWVKRGKRPIVPVQLRYEWLYLYGFVCPESGQNYWRLLPKVNYPMSTGLHRSGQVE